VSAKSAVNVTSEMLDRIMAPNDVSIKEAASRTCGLIKSVTEIGSIRRIDGISMQTRTSQGQHYVDRKDVAEGHPAGNCPKVFVGRKQRTGGVSRHYSIGEDRLRKRAKAGVGRIDLGRIRLQVEADGKIGEGGMDGVRRERIRLIKIAAGDSRDLVSNGRSGGRESAPSAKSSADAYFIDASILIPKASSRVRGEFLCP
jgi:hypothetical protein